MAPRTIRRLVWVVFVAGVAGMIVGSITDANGVAITFGLITAVAAVGLILVTAVAGPGAFANGAGVSTVDEEVAADVERRIEALVRGGADETAVRSLVTQAVALGRGPSARP